MHYVQEKLLTVADTLSRASLSNSTTKIQGSKIKCFVHTIESNYFISDYRLQQFQHKIKTDVSLKTLLTFIQNGWPKNQDQILETICPSYTCRQELTYSNEIIFKGTKMLVPKIFQNEIKHLLHTGHLAIVKTINHAKGIIYWSGINNDIMDMVNACEIEMLVKEVFRT